MPGPSTKDLVKRRDALLGPAYRLFYDEPVHFVRGEGVRLYDSEGNGYLDAYNNVPLVGHCHPRVVEALSGQVAILNTHTRYLHEHVLDYAEQLLALFPQQLDRAMFSCTGSEANELALRIARSFTGQDGVIVTRFAYHGNTSTIAQMSPPGAAPEGRAEWVETIPAPDTYRRPADLDESGVTQHYLREVNTAIERLAARGIKPAALMLDSAFTSDGIFIAPTGFLAGAATAVRNAGGLFVADEVQAGFARLGDVMWGFQTDDVIPDIVTLGKPIGNGHPLSATIVRNDVLEQFADKAHYFNTFGGNPVSAAVGLAVLSVFRDDKLADNAVTVGGYLHRQLRYLGGEFPAIGDIRGSGLLAGIELVKEQAKKEPDPQLARLVFNGMRDRRILIGSTGSQDNVLKIRPPLPFSRSDVDQLIENLSGCLAR